MKRVLICIIILLLAAVPVDGYTVEMTLHPAKAPEAAQKYQLLPKAEQLTDADAAPLYEKAIQSLPGNLQTEKTSQWLKSPLDKLPCQQVQSTLQQFKPTLQLLEQAAKCKQCDWSYEYVDDETQSQNLRGYRTLIFFLALQVRFQIAQGQYDKALYTMQTGFAMAKHLSNGPTIVDGFVGIGTGAFICRQLEQFVQRPDAPNLYWALQDLPQPVIDLTQQSKLEDLDTRERAHLLMNRLDRHVAALQCVEALRLYAAAHDGKLPRELISIIEVPVPNDPVMQKPFVYRCTGYNAVLEAPAPKGATERDAMRYELTLLTATSGQSKYTPDAAELLHRYKQSLSWQESVAMKIVIQSSGEIDGQRIPSISKRTFIFRRDHERAEWLGKKLEMDENNKVDLDKCHVIKTIMDGNAFARLTSGLDRPPVGAFINRDKEFYSRFLNRLLRHPINGGPLWGRIYGSGNKSVADLLSGAASLSIRENLEEVNGTVCYIVEAKTKYGKVTAWIAPEKGYNALRWSIHKASNDLFSEAPISEAWEGMRANSWLADFVVDDLQKIGDFWVTKSGCMAISISYNEDSRIKTRVTKYKYKVSDIQIDPDFEALEAFKIDFPDGTPVQIEQVPGVRYVWQNGKPVRRR